MKSFMVIAKVIYSILYTLWKRKTRKEMERERKRSRTLKNQARQGGRAKKTQSGLTMQKTTGYTHTFFFHAAKARRGWHRVEVHSELLWWWFWQLMNLITNKKSVFPPPPPLVKVLRCGHTYTALKDLGRCKWFLLWWCSKSADCEGGERKNSWPKKCECVCCTRQACNFWLRCVNK